MTTSTQTKETGVIAALAELPPDALIDEQALARIFGRCQTSIRRAVRRGELPRPVKLFGRPTWTARAVLDHIAKRLEAKKQEAERLSQRIAKFSA